MKKNKDGLYPCPFCDQVSGDKNFPERVSETSGVRYMCEGCFMSSPLVEGSEVAALAWNTIAYDDFRRVKRLIELPKAIPAIQKTLRIEKRRAGEYHVTGSGAEIVLYADFEDKKPKEFALYIWTLPDQKDSEILTAAIQEITGLKVVDIEWSAGNGHGGVSPKYGD